MPTVPAGVRGAAITGWGTALPDQVVTNHDLERTLDTNHDWIVERTGIVERRIGGSTAGLSVEAGRQAIERAGLQPGDIDALVLATTTPDRAVPGTSSTVQHQLGLTCGAYDLNAACSGWVYGLVNAHGLVALGAEKVLVIGTDTLARITDWDDRNTAILFADGSGAAVIEAIDGPGQLLSWHLSADGSAEDALYAEVGGKLQMEGREVFRRAVRIMVDSATVSMHAAGVTADEIALVVPHQANKRIIDAVRQRLGASEDQVYVNVDEYGNTGSASVPFALWEAHQTGRIEVGDLVVLTAFGAGFHWAAAALEF